ncbi:uncharacterized protein LOC115545477 [Gadus morhua]|uniref:uncharacterized protein LOC115545477 n=1 Tax=Gadus morhua TaxID=8049 RepID=UPI0011B802B6|nr:uncharacterized protein LOC115545477 [Gadus morhua]
MTFKSMAHVDEAHCFRSECAHPCCWERERRVRRGPVRRVVAPLSHREIKECLEEDSVATLSVVDVSEWAGEPVVPEVSITMVTEVAGLQKEGGVDSKSERPVRTHVPVSGPLSPLQGSTGSRRLKLGTAQISLVPSLPSGPTLTWMPSRTYVPQNLHREKPPRVSIKELTWFPPAELNPSIKKESKQEEKRKKKTVSLHERPEELLVLTGSDPDVDPGRPRPGDNPSSSSSSTSSSSSSSLRGHHFLPLPPDSRTVVSEPPLLHLRHNKQPPRRTRYQSFQLNKI